MKVKYIGAHEDDTSVKCDVCGADLTERDALDAVEIVTMGSDIKFVQKCNSCGNKIEIIIENVISIAE